MQRLGPIMRIFGMQLTLVKQMTGEVFNGGMSSTWHLNHPETTQQARQNVASVDYPTLLCALALALLLRT